MHRIWALLQACANFSKLWGLFKDVNGRPVLRRASAAVNPPMPAPDMRTRIATLA